MGSGSSSDLEDPFVGSTVGDRVLEALLDAGPGARVYRSRSLADGSFAAVEIITRELSSAVIERMQREALERALDFGFTAERQPYLVTELAGEVTLSEEPPTAEIPTLLSPPGPIPDEIFELFDTTIVDRVTDRVFGTRILVEEHFVRSADAEITVEAVGRLPSLLVSPPVFAMDDDESMGEYVIEENDTTLRSDARPISPRPLSPRPLRIPRPRSPRIAPGRALAHAAEISVTHAAPRWERLAMLTALFCALLLAVASLWR